MAADIKETGGEFVRFFVVGVGATLVHMGVYLATNAAFALSEEQKLALTLSYAFGYAVSFVANYFVTLKWTFKTEGSVKKGLGFAFSHAVNAGMHLALFNFFRWVGVGALLAGMVQFVCPWLVEAMPFIGRPESLLPLPVYCIVVPLNFLMVRFFVKS